MTTTTDWTALNASSTEGLLLAALNAQNPAERLQTVTTYVEQQVRHIRDLSGLDTTMDTDRSFLAIGFDSLMSVELLYHLQRDLGRDLDPALLEQGTVDDLARAILAEVYPAG